jgi:hypothetical protein
MLHACHGNAQPLAFAVAISTFLLLQVMNKSLQQLRTSSARAKERVLADAAIAASSIAKINNFPSHKPSNDTAPPT